MYLCRVPKDENIAVPIQWVGGNIFLLSLTGSEDMGIREDVPTSPIALQYDIALPPVGRL